MLLLGTYPTRLHLLEPVSTARSALWIKRDDETNPVYGGNKVRKLEELLAEAARRRASRIVTVGAVGSHHVLATGLFARSLGIEVEAIIVPQPRTEHVLENLRIDLTEGVHLFPAGSYAEAAFRVGLRLARGAYYIPPGGSNRVGVRGYVRAAKELAVQIRAGEMPEPELIVVAVGSGGTAAGLVVGLAEEGLKTKVLGVTVAEPPWLVEHMTISLAKHAAPRHLRKEPERRLQQTRSYLGRGYGYPTAKSMAALKLARNMDLALDHTYTAKTFAAALDVVRECRYRTVLYWHTLSSASLAPLLRDAPPEPSIDPRLLRLILDE